MTQDNRTVFALALAIIMSVALVLLGLYTSRILYIITAMAVLSWTAWRLDNVASQSERAAETK